MAPTRRSQSRDDDHEEAEPTMSQLISVMIQQAQELRAEREDRRAREERAEKAKEERRAEKRARQEDEARRVFVPRQGSLDSFFKLRPPSFFGSEDALAAEDWLKEVSKFLDAARISEEDKVPFATLLLKSHANIWWEAELPKYQALDINPSWAQFRTGFLKKFFPESQESVMEQKFANLVQGSLSVDEYTTEFIRLSRFCPVIAESPTEMMKKYRRGLRQEIQDSFGVVDLSTFDAVLEGARKMELVIQRKRARIQQALSGRPIQQRPLQTVQQPPRPPPIPRVKQAVQRPQLQLQGSVVQTQPGSQAGSGLPTCIYCHRTGHLRKDCWKANRLCLKCGAPDHAIATCPQHSEEISGQSRLPALAAGTQRLPHPPQRDGYRQQQGGSSQRRAQALQMIAAAQEMLREEEEPEMIQGATGGVDQQDGQFFQGVSAGTETGEVLAGTNLVLFL